MFHRKFRDGIGILITKLKNWSILTSKLYLEIMQYILSTKNIDFLKNITFNSCKKSESKDEFLAQSL